MAAKPAMPALLMTMSRPLRVVAMSKIVRTTSAGSLTSIFQAREPTPSGATRSVAATMAPSAAKPSAVPRPLQLAAPVISTTEPFIERSGEVMMSLMKIDLLSPSSFASGHPFAQYRWLRENAPVHWHEETEAKGFWAVTRFKEVWE